MRGSIVKVNQIDITQADERNCNGEDYYRGFGSSCTVILTAPRLPTSRWSRGNERRQPIRSARDTMMPSGPRT
jgi:hypothetical protein